MAEIKLNQVSTRADKDLDKKKAKERTAKLLEELNELQNLLYAESKHSLLVILQGMDASGKDGVIRNVFGHLNPQGVSVTSFKAPTGEELSHDFLWRIHHHTPAKGMIQIFNRSHYEDIVITRVHNWCDDATAMKRIQAINNWEEMLMQNNNTHILKFYLHISPEQQLERLEERMKNPEKMWKYNENDYKERELWDEYMKMYEEAFANCNQPPWNIIPSDQNWYKEYLITNKVYDTLKNLEMKFPEMKQK
ncbi:MAG TPA: PPK2 family polyphosphate kinase [Chitinophagaceae bacterium]|nr:PPK2 family polyphosphate kinase [Chitinophagaceae bacterium]